MSISRRDFNQQCLDFACKCSQLDEGWFVAKVQRGELKELDNTNSECSDDDQIILMKTHVKFNSETKDIQTHEYSIVYSESYEVPVMYFSASNQDGEPLKLDSSLSTSPGVCEQELGRVVSQVEHPLLFRPFYMIHPCKTRNIMKTHLKNTPKEYLLSWLSVIGTLLDLKLDLRLASVESQR